VKLPPDLSPIEVILAVLCFLIAGTLLVVMFMGAFSGPR
jgi:hypothetical protein